MTRLTKQRQKLDQPARWHRSLERQEAGRRDFRIAGQLYPSRGGKCEPS